MSTLDIIVIAIILLSALSGLIKGFIKTLFGFTALILALGITWFITPYISESIITQTEFDEMIEEKTSELLSLEMYEGLELSLEEELLMIDQVQLPESVVVALGEAYTPDAKASMGAEDLQSYIAGFVANMAVNALVYLLVFAAVSLLLNIIVSVLDLISHLPVLHQLNKLGGFLLGLVSGVVFIWIGCVIFSFVLSIQATSTLTELLDSSVITKLLYDYNPLQQFIMSLMEK